MRLVQASFTIAALLTVTTAGHAQSAYDYPWCALYSGRDGPGATSCYYTSREQCMQTLSGIGGTCIRSPYYGHGPGSETRPPRRGSQGY